MLRPDSISGLILEYERATPKHHAGTIDSSVLERLEEFATGPMDWTMETGCGATTIFLSNLSTRHHVFAVDDTDEERSSVRYFKECPVFRADHTQMIVGPTQRTLPAFTFSCPVDLAFLDGPHGYPFPELEYLSVYPHLRTGALLVIDDIHIPTIHHLCGFLAEDDMFDLVHVERTTAFFRRTPAPPFYPLGDGWWLQAYNKARFPIESPAEFADTRTVRLQRLESDNLGLRQQLTWWQHVAEERRLRRRLERRLPFFGRWLRRQP